MTTEGEDGERRKSNCKEELREGGEREKKEEENVFHLPLGLLRGKSPPLATVRQLSLQRKILSLGARTTNGRAIDGLSAGM